ncbi:hypothetical protein SEPCBS119000_004610 [Sporothrix epigloea]|uniref:Aminoglycoside phosphotransferase domain-containing protein n=1 Tax=Sporothrix epigloea TaxID=1892477 RepID=A0ABP0DT28_9PEZI
MSRLAEMHFDKIGSLFEDENGSYSIGECLTPSLIWQLRDELEIIDRGPFDQESQYFYSMIAAFVAHAKEFYLGPHIFFAPTPDSSQYPYWASFKEAVGRWRTFGSIFGDSKNRLSFCIAGDFLSEMVPRLISTGPFVLSHPDLHCGNIFVDDDFNITSIIDWSSASTGPLTELLAIPERNDSFLPPKESLVAAFRSGFCQGGQTIEPEQWRTADKIWHFTRLVRMLSVQDYVHFKALYDIVYEKDADDIPQVFYERSKDERGRALYAELLQDEMEWEAKEEQTRKKEEDNDRYVNKSEEPAIAMKLKLMSEMNHNFIADKRLWQWIEKALRPADSTESCVQLAENIDPIGK